MAKRSLVYFPLLVAAAALAWIATPREAAIADGPETVFVANFPATQQVAGQVVVRDPVPATAFAARSTVVSPARLTEVGSLTEGGTLDARGFASLTVGISGALQATNPSGEVGVLLLPDQPDILAAFHERGQLQFAFQVRAAVDPRTSLFHSDQATFRLLFPRYRVLYYNETAHSAQMTLFTNLASG